MVVNFSQQQFKILSHFELGKLTNTEENQTQNLISKPTHRTTKNQSQFHIRAHVLFEKFQIILLDHEMIPSAEFHIVYFGRNFEKFL